MRIAILTPVLYNAISPFNHIFKDIIGGFLEKENEVIRFVAVESEEETEYKYGYEGNHIRYELFKRKNSNHGNIISRYLRDSLTNIREARALKKLEGVDVLFEDVSYSSFWAVRAAKKKGIKVIAMLQDVWPDNAVQSHLISGGSILYKYFEMWPMYVYRHADRIICISDDMKAFIVSKGIEADKIDIIYNWGYTDDGINIAWEDNVFVKKYNLDSNKFYAVYAGNIGKMQNVEIVVNAAKELQDRKDIHFLIIGEGAGKETIEEMAKNMENITVLPMQPSEIAAHIYSAAGVNIIPMVPGGTKTALPSKTGVILSCGKPAVFTFGSESQFGNYLERYGAGMSVSADSSEELKNAILRYKNQAYDKIEGSYELYRYLFKRSENIKKYTEAVESVCQK